MFIAANWKSNKTIYQAEEWFRTINNSLVTFNKEEKEVIICPPFTLLPVMKALIQEQKLPIKLGAQNISPFDEGAYTGEINAKQIKELADYVIIGHSERRKNFSENDDVLERKVNLAIENNLTPIFCIQGRNTFIPKNAGIILYEPIEAIGTGVPDDPKNANGIAEFVKNSNPARVVLYGGSVNFSNVASFTRMSHIDGVGVGTASLDAKEFYEIIKNA